MQFNGEYKHDNDDYKIKIQSPVTATLETATRKDFKERKKNLEGVSTANLVNTNEKYSTEIQITTEEYNNLKDDFTRQLQAIKAVTNSRFIDVFDLIINKYATDPDFYKKKMTLKEVHNNNKEYVLKVDEVCHLLGISYDTAYRLLSEVTEYLNNNLHFSFKAYKRKFAPVKHIQGFQSLTLSNGKLEIYFSEPFLHLLSHFGERRPLLVHALNYDAKQLKYMGKLRNKLESDFFLSLLNSGQYKRIRLINILPLFDGANIKKRPKESFIEPLKRHLSFLEESGFFQCSFTGAKGINLSSDYRAYLEVDRDGKLIKDIEAGAGIKTIPRIKVNELLNNVYLSYTFLERPLYKITKKTAQKIRRAKERKAKKESK